LLKIYFFLILSFCTQISYAQKANFNVQKLKLPAEIAYYDNQFSGLFITNDNLLLLSESRLQDKAEPKLYSIKTADVEKNMQDTNYVLPYKKIIIKNLNVLREKIKAVGDDYEGLEAITIKDNAVYLSVETATPSNNCYLLRGVMQDTILNMDILFMLPTPKPFDANGKHIYNAGYEAITTIDETVYNIFEYNSFAKNYNIAIAIIANSYTNVGYQKIMVDELPFRVTDITKTGKKKFTAINYFYKGAGDDEVYRVPTTDVKNDTLTRDKNGYKSYCRLITMEYKKNKFTWKPLWEFPVQYRSYNWEGIAAHKNGYFIINDKYTPARPYSTVLLYVSPAK
jgi:hypothetical protein